MIFNPDFQYRYTIIRGKAQSILDSLLPAYTNIIMNSCPCSADDFTVNFNRRLSEILNCTEKKTLDNHRTEIAGKLFGMWLEDSTGTIHATQRTFFLAETSDNPAFFKDLLYKFQFPSGMEKTQTIAGHVANQICLRPGIFLVQLLYLASQENIVLYRRELWYYVLNALEVLQGRITPKDVLTRILCDRQDKIYKDVLIPNGKGYSFAKQHLKEFINLLELANLIYVDAHDGEKVVWLNLREAKTIELFCKEEYSNLKVNPYNYNWDKPNAHKTYVMDWMAYFGSIDDSISAFKTRIEDLQIELKQDEAEVEEKGAEQTIAASLTTEAAKKISTLATGDAGEVFAFEYEKKRVGRFNTRLRNKVIHLGKQRGLGYDISSIKAIRGNDAEHAIFIEVKTSLRVTSPEKSTLTDQVYMTRNEWVAAEQHRNNYYIYRVYISREKTIIFRLQNPVGMRESGIIFAEPTQYRVEFSGTSGDFLDEI